MPAADNLEASWNDVSQVDVLGLEVGYRLIPMVDKGQDGELLKRIRGLRKKFAQEVGLPVRAECTSATTSSPSPTATGLRLKGVEVGGGEAYPGQFSPSTPGASGPLAGRETTDPAFGLPAVWIDASMREQAHALGYTVDASTVVATHLNHVILNHAAELLGRQETQALLDHPARSRPSWSRTRAQAAAARHRAARAAEPARGGRQHPRHAQHHRGARRERAARAGPRPAHHKGAGGAGPRHPAGPVPGNAEVQVMALEPG